MTRAIERARATLFPARMEKWLALGFIAFLAGLGEGGGGYGFNWPFNGKSSGPLGSGGGRKSATPEPDFAQTWREGMAWIQDHLALVIALGSGALVFGFGVGLVLTWLSSRGKLMFVESVIHDRYQVKEPWARLRAPAWSIFKFRVLLAALSLLLLLAALGAGFAVAFEEIRTGNFGSKSLVGALVSVGIALVTFAPFILISLLLEDFVIPVFYLRGGTLSDAWATVRREVLAGNLGPLAVFYVLKVVLGAGALIVGMLAACLTCCVAALPYLSSVALLPVLVFFRSYSLYFLEELGIAVFPRPPAYEAFGYPRS
jgi:hypothetical protein